MATPSAEYGFNEGTGTTAADSSGNGHTLTVASGAATWVTGHYGGGLKGSGSGVGAIATGFANPTSNLTIMGWVSPHTVSGAEEPLFGFWSSPSSDPNGSSQFALYATRSAFGTSNKLVGNLRIAGSLGEIVGPAMTADTWAHVALTFDGTTIKLYVNGSLFTSVTRAGTLGVGAFGVTGRSDATADDVRVFSSALIAADIVTWMNTSVGAPPPTVQARDRSHTWALRPGIRARTVRRLAQSPFMVPHRAIRTCMGPVRARWCSRAQPQGTRNLTALRPERSSTTAQLPGQRSRTGTRSALSTM